MKSKLKQLGWVFLPSVLMLFSWPPAPLFPLVFVAFVPLFLIAGQKEKGFLNFVKIYMAILLWNIANTWWVYNASSSGFVVMLILNTLFMCLPFVVYRISKNKWGIKWALILFILTWLSYEYMHHRWDLSWPWLTLGNSLASRPEIIQWYSITGRLGGTLWILCINAGGFLYLINREKSSLVYTFSALILPAIVSLIMYFNFNPNRGLKREVVALQPSFDSWNEKFVRASDDMLKECIQIADKTVTDSTVLLVMPETTLTDFINTDNNVNGDYQVQILREYQKKHPNMEIVIGANMEKIFPRETTKKPTKASRQYAQSGVWYEVYNSSLFLGKDNYIQFQHKSKLVPGAEQMPFISLFPFIENWAVKLDENSTTGTLGVSENPRAMGNENKIGVPICYESNYGEYNGKYINDGAGLLCVITNDGWWGNTPGHVQHMLYGRLIALEHRKWVVRSANTGISCFINSKGEILQQLSWFRKGALKQQVYFNYEKTFFTKYGDYLGKMAVYLLLLLIIFLTAQTFLKNKKA